MPGDPAREVGYQQERAKERQELRALLLSVQSLIKEGLLDDASTILKYAISRLEY